jgi:hypothetical protein
MQNMPTRLRIPALIGKLLNVHIIWCHGFFPIQYIPLRDINDLAFEQDESSSAQPNMLIDGDWEIRLIQLLPSKFRDAVIQCTLLHDIFKRAKGGYETLSYVWKDTYGIEGPHQQPPRIMLNGYYFAVTRNLLATLIRLRDKSQGRILWADQI